MLILIQSATLLGALSAVFVLGHIVHLKPVWGLLFLTALISFTAHPILMNPVASFAGLNIFVLDISALIFMSASLWNFRTNKNRNLSTKKISSLKIFLTFGIILLAVSILRGMVIFGLGTAINGSRSFIYLIIFSLWAYSLKQTKADLMNLLYIFSVSLIIALSLKAFTGFVINGFGSAGSTILNADGEYVSLRPINAIQAYSLAMSTLFLLSVKELLSRRWSMLLIILGFTIVVLVQHRSVWASIIIGFLVLIVFSKENRKKIAQLTVMIIMLVLAVQLFSGPFSSIFETLIESSQNSGTYTDRQLTWQTLVSPFFQQGNFNILIGEPLGTSWDRVQNGLFRSWSPHNAYVVSLLRLGVLGLAMQLIISLILIQRSIKNRNISAVTMLASSMVYIWAYNLEWQVAFFASMVFLMHRDENSDSGYNLTIAETEKVCP